MELSNWWVHWVYTIYLENRILHRNDSCKEQYSFLYDACMQSVVSGAEIQCRASGSRLLYMVLSLTYHAMSL